MLISLCNLLRIEHPDRFEDLPEQFPAQRKQWFVRRPEGLIRGHRFDRSDIWLNTNMSTERKKRFARQILQFFGHGAEEIQFRSALTTRP
jgi:hypothetical protein